MFDGKADARSEVYALGLTLFELLAFRPAFEETDRGRLMRQILTGSPAGWRSSTRRSPVDLATIVHKAIDRDPGCRYQTARQFAEDLHCFIEDRPIQARRPWLPERLVRWSRRNKGLAAALAAIVRCSSPAPSFRAGGGVLPQAGRAGRRWGRRAEHAIDWSAGSVTDPTSLRPRCPATPEYRPGPHRPGRGAGGIPQLGVAASA